MGSAFSQTILWDNINAMGDVNHWFYTIDTLASYGVEMCTLSYYGWDDLSEIDAVWIQAPLDSYSVEIQNKLIEFTNEGGRLVIGEWRECGWHVGHNCDVMNTLLMNSNWNTNLEITDTIDTEGIGCHFYFDIFSFPPITNEICSVGIGHGEKIECGNSAYPIILSDSTYEAAVSAISYPFLFEGNCYSFVTIYADGEQLDFNVVFMNAADYFQYTKNLLLAAVDFPGYQLPPCAVPEPFEIEVDSVPECANPGDTITLTGRNLWQGSNENIGGDIEIYFYGPQDTVVIPIEYSDHHPDPHSLYNTWLKFVCPDLPDGEYDIELGHKAITFYAGSITIPCNYPPDYLCSATPNPFTPNGDGINDEVEFEFPGLGLVPGTIKIYTLGNLRVRTIEVPTGSGAKEAAKWDGRDDSGAPMRQGIYIYTIRAEGRIKCEGTATLAR